MPAPKRPEPPTEAVARGQARLLAQLSVLGGGETDDHDGGEATELSEDDGGAARSWDGSGDDARYDLGEVFAAGGLGVVRRGHDKRLRRPVAIKELLRDSPQAQRRFALEAAITARLQHPSIVPLYDLVWQGAGKPYYCMKLVDGDNLETKIAAADSLAERLRLVEHVIDVADAIAYAHDQHIIHRDIKPANVLVGGFGETVVIDWGLAKDLSGTIITELDAVLDAGAAAADEDVRDAGMTEAGTIMGTLRYMSPEQARGEGVDARSDIYSLGALLYHVLAGRAPFARAERDELVHAVIAGDTAALAKLDDQIPTELVAIAERAMALAPDQRYASAADLGEDLRRFQTGRMVSAHAYSLAEVTRRWLRRHRVAVGAGSLAVLGIGTVGLLALREVGAERRAAAEAAAAADAQSRRAERVEFEGAVLDEARRAVEVLHLARTAGRELEALAAGVELVAAHQDDAAGVPKPVYEGLSTALAGMIPVATLDGPGRSVFTLGSFSPDGSLLLTLPDPGAASEGFGLWSTQTGRQLGTIPGSLDGAARTGVSAFSPDNRLLAIGGATRCTIVELDSREVVRELDDCAEPRFSVDGATLYAKVPGGEQDQVQLYAAVQAWAVDGWAPRWAAPISGRNFLYRVDPDGERLIVRHDISDGEAIELLDAASGARRAWLAREVAGEREYRDRSPGLVMAEHMALSDDGERLVVSETDVDGHVVVWDLDSGEPTVLGLAGGMAQQPMFAARKDWQIYAGGAALDVWDTSRDQRLALLPASAQLVRAGDGVVALSEGAWLDLPSGRARQDAPRGRMRTLEASADGAFLVTVGEAGAQLWSAADHLALDRWPRPRDEFVRAFTPTQIVTRDRDDQIRVYDRQGDAAPTKIDAAPQPAFVLDRAAVEISMVVRIAKHEGQTGVVVVDQRSGERRCHVPEVDLREQSVGLSPDGETLVITQGGVAHLWDVERCRERGTIELYDPEALQPAEGVGIRFANNGALVHHRSGKIEIHGLGDGETVTIEDGCAVHNPWGDAMLSPDGRLVLSWCSSGAGAADEIRVWSLARREVVATIDARAYSSAPVFSRDGERLVFVAGERELAVVTVADGREQLRVPTEAIDATYIKLGPAADGDSVEVYTSASELVRYPITRTGLVAAACRVLRRSELADDTAAACERFE